MRELRSLPHRVSFGVIGGVRIGGFFRLSPSWSWTKPRCQRGLFWARLRSFWVSDVLDVQRKNRPPLMLLMLAWACPLMLLMLAWACRLHTSQHDCLSLSGKEFICWIKTARRDMLDQNCSRQCCSLHFWSAAMRACSCHPNRSW